MLILMRIPAFDPETSEGVASELRGEFSPERALPPGFPLAPDSPFRAAIAEPVGLLTIIPQSLVLDVAYPTVAAAVKEHSVMKKRPGNRYFSTGGAALRLVYGNEQEAIATAASIYEVHNHINGEMPESGGGWEAGDQYTAHDAESLKWVWATLVDRIHETQERYVGDLGEEGDERFYSDAAAFARFFGIPDQLVPADFGEFDEYFENMIDSGKLGSTETSREMVQTLLHPESMMPDKLDKLAKVLRGLTTLSLDGRIREQLGIEIDKEEWNQAVKIDEFLRKHYDRLPAMRRKLPDALLAFVRLQERFSPIEERRKKQLEARRAAPVEEAVA